MPWLIKVALEFLTPYALYIAIGLAISGGLTGVYFKIRHDEKVRVIQQIEKEKDDAISKATKERDRIRQLCLANPSNCTPDDEFRD